MNWKDEAWRLKRIEGLSWTQLFAEIKNRFPEVANKSNQSIRSAVRQRDKKYQEGRALPLPPPQESHYDHYSGNHFKIGIVADTHLNSKYQQLTYLNKAYDIFKAEGVKSVYHAGDITAGEGMFLGQIYEVFNLGFSNQANYIIEKYPKREGITTYFITGNHDLCYYKQKGADIGDFISAKRSDLVYLGKFSAWVSLGKNAQMYILHPEAGPAYAYSYKPQKIIERGFAVGKEPAIMVLGHWHQMEYFFDRNIHVIQAGCFEGQSDYLRRKGILPKIGFWILEGEIDNDGNIVRLKQEAIIFPTQKEFDY